MTHCSVLRSAALAGTFVVALSVIGTATASAATNQEVHMAANLSADAGSGAVTYDPQLAPEGARLVVDTVDTGEGDTRMSLNATGLAPNHRYTASAHVRPCGSTATDAGARFRNAVDPAAGRPAPGPSAAPAAQEIAMDLRTDANGDGHAETAVPFSFDTRAPRSVVVEEAGTAGGGATTAGTPAPAACLTLPAA